MEKDPGTLFIPYKWDVKIIERIENKINRLPLVGGGNEGKEETSFHICHISLQLLCHLETNKDRFLDRLAIWRKINFLYLNNSRL